jgi:hypothetical protein
MAHALTIEEAAEIHADGALTLAQRAEVVALIASEYEVTCRYVEDRIACLARRAPPRKGVG